jgi:hypothetical protein|tara:strand:- start:604 stop:828 length:225 start_codon:yes stop_codon:yes gene_type:complete
MAEDKVKLSLRGEDYKFGIVLAQRILTSANNLRDPNGYKLNDDKYTLTNGRLVKRRSNKGDSSKSTTQGADTEG